MSEKFTVAHLDELTPEEGDEGARWFRLRRDLDVGAFGVNAYGADAGNRVIEEHDELGSGAGRHEELYLVFRGSARFRLGGDEVRLGPQEMVFIRDPSVRRGAIAEEDGTVVLVIGGQPGRAYEVSTWEQAADAFPHWRKGDYETAVQILQRVADEHPEAASVLYNLACAETLKGDHEQALEHLRQSIELEKRFRELAMKDEDFDAVRERHEFRELVGSEA